MLGHEWTWKYGIWTENPNYQLPEMLLIGFCLAFHELPQWLHCIWIVLQEYSLWWWERVGEEMRRVASHTLADSLKINGTVGKWACDCWVSLISYPPLTYPPLLLRFANKQLPQCKQTCLLMLYYGCEIASRSHILPFSPKKPDFWEHTHEDFKLKEFF